MELEQLRVYSMPPTKATSLPLVSPRSIIDCSWITPRCSLHICFFWIITQIASPSFSLNSTTKNKQQPWQHLLQATLHPPPWGARNGIQPNPRNFTLVLTHHTNISSQILLLPFPRSRCLPPIWEARTGIRQNPRNSTFRPTHNTSTSKHPRVLPLNREIRILPIWEVRTGILQNQKSFISSLTHRTRVTPKQEQDEDKIDCDR